MKDIVAKPSATIAIKADLNLLERQLWNILFAHSYQNLATQEVYEVSENILLSYLPYKTRNTEHLKKCLHRLVHTTVEYDYLGKDGRPGWCVFGLMSQAKLESGVCSWAYAPELRKLLNNPRIYAKISLLISQKLSSKYALILYELCLDYIGVRQTPWIDLKQFREIVGIKESEYKEWYELKRWVLSPAVNEVTKKADIQINFLTQRTGKRISHIKFLVEKKSNFQPDLTGFKPSKSDQVHVIKEMLAKPLSEAKSITQTDFLAE